MGSRGEEFSQIDISAEEKEKLVAEVVRYVLFKTHQTAGCPVKREELTQLVTKNYRQKLLPALVIQEAGAKLSGVFGYKLKELQRARSSSTRQGRSSQQSVDAKSYVLESQIPPDIYKSFVEDKKNSHLNGFTFAVISNVYLSGAKISEENLWHHLRRLGLKENDENHPVFGNVKNLLETLVQQRYLLKEKLSGAEGNSVMYELAERSLDESFIQKVEDYIAKYYRGRKDCLVHSLRKLNGNLKMLRFFSLNISHKDVKVDGVMQHISKQILQCPPNIF